MCECIQRGVFCRHLIVLLLWLWNLSFLGNLNLKGVAASSSINTSHVLVPSRSPNPIGEIKESNSASFSLQQTPSSPRNPESSDDEEFPLWIIVLIIVTVGLIVIACILCLIRFYRWKKDHGTYSMWNSQEPSVEAMYARESGVLFERLDIETSLAEAQCYEIPVDSFQAPQRIYVDGIRVTPLSESMEERDTKRSLSEADGEIHVIDGTQYCPVKNSASYPNDITGQRESLPSSSGPDTSQRSSVSTTTTSERGLTPGHETPGAKELYPKALPVIPVEDTPAVLCETDQLDVDDGSGRVSALVNRPLPQTPPLLSPPPIVYSAASLDRTLLKQQKEAKLDKPNTFRTLPRPRKIRQIPLPFFSAITRSASSNDVNKETERLSDHVASDAKICTLTRVKKRLSQSLDTLMASQRVSHFYENPYGTHEVTDGNKERIPGTIVDPPYSRVSSIATTSNENLPKDKEHLYTRISQYMDGQDNHINRHSYASVHYPSFRSRPKSKHVYISIIFGSAESVFIPSIDNPNTNEETTKLTRTRSKSCPTLNTSTGQPSSDANTKYTPRPNSYHPPTTGLCFADTSSVNPQVLNGINKDLMSFPDSQYQNIRESLSISPLVKAPLSQNSTGVGVNLRNGYQNLQESIKTLKMPSQNPAEAGVYKTPKSLDIRPYYENITCVKDSTSWNAEQKDHIDTSHYGVPKSPAIPLQRVRDILHKTSAGNAEGVNWLRRLKNEDSKVSSKDDGGLEICSRKRSADNEKCAKNGERETFSTYLEGRFNGDEYIKQVETIGKEAERNESCSREHKSESYEPMYENFISTNRDSCASEGSVSSLDHLSLGSSLSIADKEVFENQPLIPKTSDVNGNSVCDGFVEKIEVRKNSLSGSNLFGESVA